MQLKAQPSFYIQTACNELNQICGDQVYELGNMELFTRVLKQAGAPRLYTVSN
jgi:hypothetical protein